MAAIFRKGNTYFIRFKDSQGVLRVMELPKGREILNKEFEKRKRELQFFINRTQRENLVS